MNSSLSGASGRAKSAPALSCPELRFLHHSLICSPLESLVPTSTSFSVPFIFSTTLCHVYVSFYWIVSSRSLLFWMSDFVPALFSGYRWLQQTVLDLPCTRLLACCCPPSGPSRTVRTRMPLACCCLALLTTTNCLSISSRRSIFSGSLSAMMSSPWVAAVVCVSRQ